MSWLHCQTVFLPLFWAAAEGFDMLLHTALESRANQPAELTRQVLLKLYLQGRTKKTKGFGAHKGKVKKSILNCADAQLEIGTGSHELGQQLALGFVSAHLWNRSTPP